MSATFIIRTLLPSEWARYRAVRLRSLCESPHAFGSTFEAERERTDDDWKARLSALVSSEEACLLIAEQADETIGLVLAKTEPIDRSAVNVFQMWVAPGSRGRGVGGQLLGAALAWARARRARYVRLAVTCGDTSAARLYARHGFKPVGPVEALRPGCALTCQPMRLVLDERTV